MMPVPAEGRCAVGCSKSFRKEEYGNFIQWASQALTPEDFERIPAWGDMKEWPGRIVGACDYAARRRDDLRLEDGDSVRSSSAPYQWDEGYAYWWDLSEVVCFDRPIPCRGNVGMWQMSDMLAAQVAVADSLARSVGTRVSTAWDASCIFRQAFPIVGKDEGVFVLPLDSACHTLAAPILVSLGSASMTAAVSPKEIFAEALKLGADSIILAHNHASGDPVPSIQDRQLTGEIANLGKALGIRLQDHLILTQTAIHSIVV